MNIHSSTEDFVVEMEIVQLNGFEMQDFLHSNCFEWQGKYCLSCIACLLVSIYCASKQV